MGNSFPKSTWQNRQPRHSSGEGGRRVKSVVLQGSTLGVKHCHLSARLRVQCSSRSSNQCLDLGKEFPMAPSLSRFSIQKEHIFENRFYKGVVRQAEGLEVILIKKKRAGFSALFFIV